MKSGGWGSQDIDQPCMETFEGFLEEAELKLGEGSLAVKHRLSTPHSSPPPPCPLDAQR